MCYDFAMQIAISNPYLSTWIFTVFLLAAIIVSARKEKNENLLSLSITGELKGVAILAVIFCHIGYFLVTNNTFLFPLSIASGIGVDIFLFLSGFGLTISALSKNITVLGFYKKHLAKIYVPLWIILAVFFLMNFFVAHIGYSQVYIIKSFLGIFTSADIFHDINSPLWFITFILFYYLLFPIVFSKKYPWLSAISIFLCGFLIVKINPVFFAGVMSLYRVHILAFPVGILYASVIVNQNINAYIKKMISNFSKPLYYFFILLLAGIIGYLAFVLGSVHGIFWQMLISMIATLSVVKLFVMKRVHIGLFSLLGLYSFEIYLIHWPIMYHYDIFYRYVPAWLATILYLGLFLGLGFILKKISGKAAKLF